MAFRPCVSCGRPFFGGSAFTYVTWFDGDERHAFRMLQCGGCAAELRNTVVQVADARRDDAWEVSPELAVTSAAATAPESSAAVGGRPGVAVLMSSENGVAKRDRSV